MQKTQINAAVEAALAPEEPKLKPLEFPWEVIRDFITTVASLGSNQYQLAMGEKMVEAGKMKQEDLAPLRQMVIEQTQALTNMDISIRTRLHAIEDKRAGLVLPRHLM